MMTDYHDMIQIKSTRRDRIRFSEIKQPERYSLCKGSPKRLLKG